MRNGFLDNLPDLGLNDRDGKKHRKKTQPVKLNEGEAAYSFPTKSRCPFCGSLNTVAENTKGGVQYRKCKDCEEVGKKCKYTVRGTRI